MEVPAIITSGIAATACGFFWWLARTSFKAGEESKGLRKDIDALIASQAEQTKHQTARDMRLDERFAAITHLNDTLIRIDERQQRMIEDVRELRLTKERPK